MSVFDKLHGPVPDVLGEQWPEYLDSLKHLSSDELVELEKVFLEKKYEYFDHAILALRSNDYMVDIKKNPSQVVCTVVNPEGYSEEYKLEGPNPLGRILQTAKNIISEVFPWYVTVLILVGVFAFVAYLPKQIAVASLDKEHSHKRAIERAASIKYTELREFFEVFPQASYSVDSNSFYESRGKDVFRFALPKYTKEENSVIFSGEPILEKTSILVNENSVTSGDKIVLSTRELRDYLNKNSHSK